MPTRRQFLIGATALGALACIPACWVPPVQVQQVEQAQSCVVPPDFPPSIPLVEESFENWSRARSH